MASRKKVTRPSASSRKPPVDRATAYAQAVVSGELVAGPHVRNACRRHLDDLKRGAKRGLTWNEPLKGESERPLDRVFGFFETVLHLAGGQYEGKAFTLEPSQAFIVGSIFGWRRADGTRRFRRAYVEQGKGNGKSPMVAGVGMYGLTADDEARAEVYAAASKKDQAMVLFRDAVAMYQQSPLLARRITPSGGNPIWNLSVLSSGSFFRPISSESGQSGPRPHMALCDEVHEHPNRDVLDMLERGFKWRRQPLLLMITNSGSDRTSACWEEHLHAVRVAAGTMAPDEQATYVGEVIDDSTFSYVCALDPGDDPLTDRRCWIKANPLLGVTVQEDYLAGVVQQAIQMPGRQNSILRLHFCVWTDAESAWISRQALEAVMSDFDPLLEHAGKEVSTSADLSGSTDLTASAFVVETGTKRVERDGQTVELPTYDAWVVGWTPKDTLIERARSDQAPYDVWVEQGHLIAVPGKIIRLDYVAAYLAQAAAEYVIKLLAYDRYAYRKLEVELDALGVTIPQLEHPQGGIRRGKPLEEEIEEARRAGEEPPEGLWMPGSVNTLETLILEGRIRIKMNPAMVSAAMSATIETDAFNNRWFSKRRSVNRIDFLVALAMAVGAATRKRPPSGSVYESRGLLVFG